MTGSIIGTQNTGHFVEDQAAKSFSRMITRLMPNGTAPLFALSSYLKSVTAVAVEHGFWTKTMIFPAFDLTADITDTATTFTVASTDYLLPGQIHRLEETGELVIINRVVDATHIEVTRSLGSVAAAAVTVASDISEAYLIGNAHEESSLRPQAQSLTPIKVTNLTQIFRNAWAVSGSADATQVAVGDSNVAENRRDCASFHAQAIEKALFFSQKSQGYRNGQPFRTMDGLIPIVSNIAYYPPSYATPNVNTALATTSYTQLEAMLDPCFDQVTDMTSSASRLLFVGSNARKVINKIGLNSGTYNLEHGQTQFGLQFDSFKITRGEFNMIEHPIFNTNPYWSNMAVAVDLSSFALAYLSGRDTKPEEYNTSGDKVVDNGIDAVGGSLLTEVTCEIQNPPANAVIYGLTAAA